MRMAEGLMKGLKQAVNMKKSDELLDHLIEENFRLIERLRAVSSKSERRKKQIAHLTKGVIRKKALKDQLDLAERGNTERTRQITMYSNELAETVAKWNTESSDLLKTQDDMEKVIETLTLEKETLEERNEELEEGIRSAIVRMREIGEEKQKESTWTKLKKLFKR